MGYLAMAEEAKQRAYQDAQHRRHVRNTLIFQLVGLVLFGLWLWMIVA